MQEGRKAEERMHARLHNLDMLYDRSRHALPVHVTALAQPKDVRIATSANFRKECTNELDMPNIVTWY